MRGPRDVARVYGIGLGIGLGVGLIAWACGACVADVPSDVIAESHAAPRDEAPSVSPPTLATRAARGSDVVPAITDDPFTPAAALPNRETDLAPSFEAGAVLHRGRTDDRVVALTFDDGPGGANTRRVLRVLGKQGVRATFFVLGANARREPKLLAAIANAGHELGNHASSHTSFRSLFPSQIDAELDQTADAIEAITGLRPRFVRPPFGRFPPSAVDLIRERGEDIVLWSVDANDWAGGTAESIAEGVVAAAQPGAVILMHDTAPQTADALPLVLDGLARRGLRVVPLSELLARPAWAT